MFFFCKQKTAYEMRISYWSSDVCSSDLTDLLHLEDATISRTLLEQVMTVCVARARDQHFPFVLGETFAFDYLPDIGTFLATRPTLRDAARVFDWVRAQINPLINGQLEEEGDLARRGGAAPAGGRWEERRGGEG